MPKSSPSKTKYAQGMRPTSQKLDLIDSWLKKMLDRFPEKGQITTSEIEDWHRDLTPFSEAAIDFSFDKMRMGIFFPKNGQVIDLCMTWDPPEQKVRTNANCDAICKARHGKGYSETDIKYLWEIYTETILAMPRRPMTDGEIEGLLEQVDRKRGFKPEWRKEIA